MTEIATGLEALSVSDSHEKGLSVAKQSYSWEDVKGIIPEKYIKNAIDVLQWRTGPTRIQAQVLKKIATNEENKSEKHIVAQAELGSGKTGMFGFAILRKIDPNKGLQALILCHTRELAIQTADEISKMAGNDVRVWTAVPELIAKVNNDVKDGPPQIVVGTTGTVNAKMVKKRDLKKKEIELIVVDEAD
eukprot:CAMPEP_0185271810 /NCGR_PEP_ID=MMETSP1359-20130426/45664_1 /TAXON_ID=552665 /ORGANISM="Bigelowiella longifila, Strain CCMP242" /LENGTH=189 /DNA_ID=CAMNT_0027863879 /DNA_START=42 /DNA_END=608 /DNA_ORIENTATION=+